MQWSYLSLTFTRGNFIILPSYSNPTGRISRGEHLPTHNPNHDISLFPFMEHLRPTVRAKLWRQKKGERRKTSRWTIHTVRVNHKVKRFGEPPKCQLTDVINLNLLNLFKSINLKLWYTFFIYASVVEIVEILLFTATWMGPEGIMLREMSQTEKKQILNDTIICGMEKSQNHKMENGGYQGLVVGELGRPFLRVHTWK